MGGKGSAVSVHLLRLGEGEQQLEGQTCQVPVEPGALLTVPVPSPAQLWVLKCFLGHCGWKLKRQNKSTRMSGAKTVQAELAVCEFSE